MGEVMLMCGDGGVLGGLVGLMLDGISTPVTSHVSTMFVLIFLRKAVAHNLSDPRIGSDETI